MKNKVTENKGSFEFLFKGTGEAPEKLELKSRDTSQRYMAPYQLSFEWFMSQVRVQFQRTSSQA